MPPFPSPKRAASSNGSNGRHTPKHGSWLDMAESELAVLTRQCLSRRTPDKQTLEKDAAAWERQPKQAPRQSRLAIHNSPRPRQAQKAVPSVRMTRATRVPGACVLFWVACALHHFVGPPEGGVFALATGRCSLTATIATNLETAFCIRIFCDFPDGLGRRSGIRESGQPQ